tara:strand:+ start:2090 stop:2929 length:840 start_codon:yes stop_codon:yes gene_type:complete
MNFFTKNETKIQIEDVQKFWDRQPCNIKHSTFPVGTKEYFDGVEQRKYFVEPHIPNFCNFKKWKEKKVLEIGCGLGTDAINFARAGAILTVVELSKKSLDLAKKRFKLYNLSAKFFLGNAEELSKFVPVESYDLIYSSGVIHHSPNPEKIVNEIEKYCDKNTEIRILLYNKYGWKFFDIILRNWKFWKLGARHLSKKYSEAQVGSPVTFYYSVSDTKKLLKKFKISKIVKTHIFLYKIDKYIEHKYHKEWYFKYILPDFLLKKIERIFGSYLLIFAKKI